MKAFWITLFSVAMFLLLPLNTYVHAEVVEQTRIFQIDPSDTIDYGSVLNIANESNNQYTNYEKLVVPFIENTSISGGFSGSFMPPTKFQLDSASSSAVNNHLILSSFVKFEQKNLLSGSSVSWWRCPYYYNGSFSSSRNWNLDLSIYHVDLPRQVNISWENAISPNNYPALPTDSAHPSLIFEKSYSDCGQTQNNEQYNLTNSFTLPVNDTLVNPELPLETDPLSPDYNPYLYNLTLDYSFTWFNVTAPIYPNETYMVIWDIRDIDMGVNDAGSCYITGTDIGEDGYGRSLISWNDQNIYEMPIDLDCSVIFQYGMGAGVTGHKLQDNDPDVQHHTSLFSNPSFETATFQYEEDFSNALSWNTYYTTSVSSSLFSWVRRDDDANHIEIRCNRSGYFSGGGGSGVDSCNNGQWGEFYYDFSPQSMSSEGTTFRFDITLEDAIINPIGYQMEGTTVKLGLLDQTAQQGWVAIQRLKTITGGGVTIDNRMYWLDPSYSLATNWVQLPEVMPSNLYVVLQCGLAFGGDNYIHIYDQSAPNYVWFSQKLTNNYRSGSGFHATVNTVLVSAVGINSVVDSDFTMSNWNTPIATVRGYSGVERTANMNGWSIGGSWVESPSKHDFYGDGFETTVPEYDHPPSPTNTKAFGFIQESTSSLTGIVSQYSSVFPTKTNRRYFASVNVRLMPDSLTESTSNSYFRFQISGYDGAWHDKIEYFRSWDGAWHNITVGHLYGDFTQLYVSLTFQFETASSFDHKIGLVDNFNIMSISNDNYAYHRFNKEIDKTEWDSTNYYTFMMPFKYSIDPDFAPFCILRFKDSSGITKDTFYTTPSNFYGDFIMYSIKTSLIDITSTYVQIDLYSFCDESYIFLFDKNNDFIVNNKFQTDYNHIWDYNSSSILISENFFSPYYSLRTTEGQWVNADSQYTTSYFYYVVVRFVEFQDNDPQVISIRYDSVDVKDFELYRENLKTFGDVYSAEEWKVYLDIRNRPSFSDRIWDAFCDFGEWLDESGLGIFFNPLGFLLYKVLEFLAPYLESGIDFIIDVVQFFISIAIFIFGTWMMWKFVAIWILIGEGRAEEGIEIANDTSRRVIDKVKSGIQAGVGAIGKIFSGGAV